LIFSFLSYGILAWHVNGVWQDWAPLPVMNSASVVCPWFMYIPTRLLIILLPNTRNRRATGGARPVEMGVEWSGKVRASLQKMRVERRVGCRRWKWSEVAKRVGGCRRWEWCGVARRVDGCMKWKWSEVEWSGKARGVVVGDGSSVESQGAWVVAWDRGGLKWRSAWVVVVKEMMGVAVEWPGAWVVAGDLRVDTRSQTWSDFCWPPSNFESCVRPRFNAWSDFHAVFMLTLLISALAFGSDLMCPEPRPQSNLLWLWSSLEVWWGPPWFWKVHELMNNQNNYVFSHFVVWLMCTRKFAQKYLLLTCHLCLFRGMDDVSPLLSI
jgi:hypothetical protein